MKRLVIKYIQECFKKDMFTLSAHALQRMKERKITLEEIKDCIIKGETIEIQDFFKDVHVLFQESSDRPVIYVVVAACNPPMVVTVCRTKDEIWEVCNGILKRRKKRK